MLPATASIISIIQMLSEKQQKQIMFKIRRKFSSLSLFLGGSGVVLTVLDQVTNLDFQLGARLDKDEIFVTLH